MIRIEHLKKQYPNITPLEDVSVEIHDGDVISVIGPSGTGKSTLLRCINLLENPTSGRIWIDEDEITDTEITDEEIPEEIEDEDETPDETEDEDAVVPEPPELPEELPFELPE